MSKPAGSKEPTINWTSSEQTDYLAEPYTAHRLVADHGLVDEKGRKVGGEAVTYLITPRRAQAYGGGRFQAGTWYMVAGATRDGKGYGASQRGDTYPSLEAAQAAAERKLAAQGKAYAKKYGPAIGPSAADIATAVRQFQAELDSPALHAAILAPLDPHGDLAQERILRELDEDGYRLRDEEAAAEALGYTPEPRARSDEDDEREYAARHDSECACDQCTYGREAVTSAEDY